jgi:ABC-type enterochelin transport system substrate-binding protein
MGFSLKQFFDELQELLATEMKPKKKQKAIEQLIARAKKYAAECGQLH